MVRGHEQYILLVQESIDVQQGAASSQIMSDYVLNLKGFATNLSILMGLPNKVHYNTHVTSFSNFDDC